MDDYKIIIYIIIAAIALISKLGKGNKKKVTPPKINTPTDSGSDGGLTFEELLKEFTEEKSEHKPPVEHKEVQRAENVTSFDDDEIKLAYKRSVEQVQAISSSSDTRTSMDQRHSDGFEHFDAYDDFEEPEEENEIVGLLRTSDGPRKAIILSEILNRKY